MRRFVTLGPVLMVILAAGVLLLGVPAAARRIAAARTQAAVEVARQTLAGLPVLGQIDAATRAIASAVTPSVVHIEVIREGGFHGRLAGSSGAGWVYDDAGHIVTNAHVAGDGRIFHVYYHDGFVQSARLVRSDAITDIAVLEVDAGPWLFPIPRATGQRLQPGERVYAFGSPFGLKFSMTEGIISGLGRAPRGVLGFTGISNYIQHDAAVNPGNSGGPLVDVGGRLVGMNVAIANAVNSNGGRDEGQSAGISFAIPLGTIEARVPQLIAHGRPTPAFIGIGFGDGSRHFDVPGFRGLGVPVANIVPGGPAERAGLRRGDFIVAIDREPVPSLEVLRALVATAAPGERVSVRYLRDAQVLDVSVTLDRASDELVSAQHLALAAERTGLAIVDLPSGPVVAAVEPGSAAALAGFAPGMQVLSIAGRGTGSPGQAGLALADAGFSAGDRVAFVVKTTEGDQRTLGLGIYSRGAD